MEINKGKWKETEEQPQKRQMVSGTRCPCVSVCECDGERGSGPKGADDQCLVSFEA